MQRQLKNENGNKKYVLSFTAGGILHAESIAILHEFLKTQSWDQTRENIIGGNLMGDLPPIIESSFRVNL